MNYLVVFFLDLKKIFAQKQEIRFYPDIFTIYVQFYKLYEEVPVYVSSKPRSHMMVRSKPFSTANHPLRGSKWLWAKKTRIPDLGHKTFKISIKTTDNTLQPTQEVWWKIWSILSLFCIINKIWVHPSHLYQPYPNHLHDIGPQHPGCYSNSQAKYDGVVAELYNFVPPHFHIYLEGSKSFSEKVSMFNIP